MCCRLNLAVLYKCKQYSDKELLLEMLKLTVFLCENWLDYYGFYMSLWHIGYDVEEGSLFNCAEVVYLCIFCICSVTSHLFPGVCKIHTISTYQNRLGAIGNLDLSLCIDAFVNL